MAKISEYYRGKRKKRNRVLIPAAALLGLVSLVVVLFYGMQKYVVITKDSVHIVSPLLQQQEEIEAAEEGRAELEQYAETDIVFEEPDYSGVSAMPLRDLKCVRAIFVSADELYPDKIQEYADRLNVGNALVLEMKPKTGILKWNSKAWSATAFGLAGDPLSDQMRTLLDELKEKGVYLVAQISICRDDLYASRSTVVTLRNDAGYNYIDADGATWLDAYSLDVRNYAVSMVRELYELGFDEVVLADVRHPVLEEDVKLQYTRDMSTPPSAINAVCGFAVSVAQELEDRPGALSIYINSAKTLVGRDPSNGQDGPLFFKLFDRVYYPTDRYAYSFNLDDLKGKNIEGALAVRFVPVVTNYLPDNAQNISWVLIDTGEE